MKLFAQMLFVLTLLSGCASRMTYAELKPHMPALKENEGRIVVYWPSTFWGSGGVIPDIRLNGEEVIGRTKIGSFFFVDKPAGSYTCSVRTEVTNEISFLLAPGETKYLRNYGTPGFFAAHIHFEATEPDTAETELMEMRYSGDFVPPTAAFAAEEQYDEYAEDSEGEDYEADD